MATPKGRGRGDRAQVDPVTGAILETAQLREEGLRDLRAAMAACEQPYPRTDDQFLLAFLRARKYNVEKAL